MWGTSLTDFKVSRNADITSSQQRKNVIVLRRLFMTSISIIGRKNHALKRRLPIDVTHYIQNTVSDFQKRKERKERAYLPC